MNLNSLCLYSSDDGVRLYVNTHLLIDNWTPHGATEDTGAIELVGGKQYDINLVFFENGGYASIRLEWSSDCQEREIVPQSQLYAL